MKAIVAGTCALALGLGVAVAAGAPAANGVTGRGYVDPTYGSNGSFTASPSLEGVTAMYAQSDGKVVFAGPIPGGAELYRLNTDGTPDRTFSGDGVAPLNLGNSQHGPLLAPRSGGGTWVGQVQTSGAVGELRIDALTASRRARFALRWFGSRGGAGVVGRSNRAAGSLERGDRGGRGGHEPRSRWS